MSNIIIMILGMHRSGTSLTASWLQSCGLHIGNNLAGNAIGNVRGQFEDIEFLQLHDAILKSNGLSYKVSTQKINTFHWQTKMAEIIQAKNVNTIWGWKEPRTCLFLKEYHQLIPDSKALIIYRPYLDVVDSLVRRFIKTEKKRKRRNILAKYFNIYIKYQFFKKYVGNEWLKVWIRYNNDILQYIEQKQTTDFLVSDLDYLKKNSLTLLNLINNQFGIELKAIDFNTIFEKELIQQNNYPYRFSKQLILEANRIDEAFQQLKLN